jgi:metal-responsive CopG/Arc/MetJ family transcriptional regulator
MARVVATMCRAEMNIEKWFIRSRARAVPRREFISSRSELIRDRRKCLQSREKEREREREREGLLDFQRVF